MRFSHHGRLSLALNARWLVFNEKKIAGAGRDPSEILESTEGSISVHKHLKSSHSITTIGPVLEVSPRKHKA